MSQFELFELILLLKLDKRFEEFELFELILLLKLDEQFPIEQFDASRAIRGSGISVSSTLPPS